MGPCKILVRLVTLAANIVDSHICNIWDQNISSSTFAEQAKIANVRLIYQKGRS